jgi:hypothetical protein
VAKKPGIPAPRSAKPAEIDGSKLFGPMKVRATRLGYYDLIRRREGDVFFLHDPKGFSAQWMEQVDPRTAEKITTGNQALKQMHDEEMRARSGMATDMEPDAENNPLSAQK